ncbi:MAG: PQQ-binding-like beta-propeller repeat protein [Planctomycetes bacterium]|nr:PQQ-binding-like beta-propeller repeat protein [Planctomycetota bacterium]
MSRSRHLAVVLLAATGATAAAAAVTAQQPAAAPLPRLLLGHRVLRGADFATERELPSLPRSTAAEWRVDGSWRLDGALLDLGRGERFVFGKDSVSRLQLDGSVVWSAPTVAGIDFDDRALAAAQLAGPRLLLRGRGGGVVALDRASGREAWHKEAVVDSVLTADHELVCGGGSVGAAGRLWACALGNGARAFEIDLPGPPEQIVLAPFGIAVRLATAVVVFDRAGPRLGGLDAPARTLLAGHDGWFLVVPEAVVSCTRDGRERWRTPRSPLGFEQEQVVSDGGGRLLLVRACTIADDGAEVTCLDADDGTVVWTTTLPGLGVTHSKYVQRVSAFVSGGHLVVLSQASGGDFAEQVALDDGARGRRVQFSR